MEIARADADPGQQRNRFNLIAYHLNDRVRAGSGRWPKPVRTSSSCRTRVRRAAFGGY
jgi:hypothetical protein